MFIGEKKAIIKSCFDVSDIKLAELPVDLKFVAEKCGMDIVVSLLKNLQGTNIYVPKVAHLKAFIGRYIKENEAKSIKEIAREANVSENFIRILKCEQIT